MSVLRSLVFGSLLATTLAARMSQAKLLQEYGEDILLLEKTEAGDNGAHLYGNYVTMKISACNPGETYGLDDKGRCRLDINDNGVGDRFAPDECCLACHPGATYERDDQGRCRTDINNNGVLDRFANGECCECDTNAHYGRDTSGRCRTDVNKNGLLDRFAKDVCCGDKVAYGHSDEAKFTFKHPTYGDINTKEQCKSKKLGVDGDESMSTRNTADCIACVTEGSKFITHPERCVADESVATIEAAAAAATDSNFVAFPSRPGGDMMTFPEGCPQRNPGNPVTWVAFVRKCVQPRKSSMTVHGSSTTGSFSPMPPAVANKCCKTASKCPEASVIIPEKVPSKYDINTLRSSGECVAADGAGNPTETVVENVCCAAD